MSFQIKKVHVVLNTMEKINPHQEISQWNFRILGTKNEHRVQETGKPHRKKTKGIPGIRLRGNSQDNKCTPGKEGNIIQTEVSQKALGAPFFRKIKLRE